MSRVSCFSLKSLGIVLAQQTYIVTYIEKNQASILLATSNIIASVQLNPTFFIQLFLFDEDKKGTTFSVITCQPSGLQSGYSDSYLTFKEGPVLRVRKSQILTRAQPV